MLVVTGILVFLTKIKIITENPRGTCTQHAETANIENVGHAYDDTPPSEYILISQLGEIRMVIPREGNFQSVTETSALYTGQDITQTF